MIDIHEAGNAKCPHCCCGGPYKHEHENCEGLVHERLADYDEEGYYHNYKCDKCSKTNYQVGYEDYEIGF